MSTVIIVRLIACGLAALATGALMVNWIGLARAMARLSSASMYTEFHQASTQTFDPNMPTVVCGALLGRVALAALPPGRTSTAGRLAAAGVLCYWAVLAIGLPTGVRINKLIARWPIDHPPADWAFVRARWIRFHILRTLFWIPALIFYLLSGRLAGP